jgi:hypothetical protein
VGISQLLVQIHITCGVISLITGAVVLSLTKGTKNHKKIGKIFVYAMMVKFPLGMPLGTYGQLALDEPANLMTAIGAMLVGTVTFSGYRLVQANAGDGIWYDKAMLGLQIFTAFLYFYLAILTVLGSDFLGLVALTNDAEQFTLFDNSFAIFTLDYILVGTAGSPANGTIFAVIASETFLCPLFLSGLLVWFSSKTGNALTGR